MSRTNIALSSRMNILIMKIVKLNLSNITSTQENYEISIPLGRGKYSEVHEGYDVRDNTKVVIKLLKPVRESKITRELKILQALDGHKSIIRLLDYCMDK